MYLRWKTIPELRDLPEAERYRLWQEAQRLGPVDLLWVPLLFAPAVPMFCILRYAHSALGNGWKEGIARAGMTVIWLAIFSKVLTRRDQSALRRVRARDVRPSTTSSWMTWPRYLCAVGGAFWITAAPMILGRYLDMQGQTREGMLFGTIFLAVGAAFFVFAWQATWRVRRHRDRATHGLCVWCGYDLRATPDRCPECGQIPKPSR